MPAHMDLLSPDIPPELFLQIFRFLDAKSLVRCCSVCHVWDDLIRDTIELRYSIELLAEGMVREPSVTGCDPNRDLQTLLTRRRAWQTLEWTSKVTVDVEPLTRGAWELAGGIFIQHQPRNSSILSVAFSRDQDPRTELTQPSPQAIRDFRDLALDPTQDLLVRFYAVSGDSEHAHLHFVCRTISTDQPHPLAAHATLCLSLDRDVRDTYFSMQIAEDIVCVFYYKPPFSFHIINWKKGIRVVHLMPDRSVGVLGVTDIHLLTPRSFIGIDTSPYATVDSGRIDVFTFDGEHPNPPTLIATFELPKTFPGKNLVNAKIFAGAYCANMGSVVTPPPPFLKSNESRIFMLHLRHAVNHWFWLFVPFHVFHKYVANAADDGPRLVLWDEWGSTHSRMLAGSARNMYRAVHGSRVALPFGERQSGLVQILDFGATIQRSAALANPDVPSSSADIQVKLHTGPSNIPSADYVFLSTITTTLPYLSTVRKLGPGNDIFLLDQDRLCAMNSAAGNTGQMTVYTF
ncbi:F-box domain-containing protein [Favolaschia claudopus]|uniref:F-box domain-containing protein n=1 Tax=Favolaschia claudopus TaxID=2862362 RepID=A0AAW0BSX1_9AGAR